MVSISKGFLPKSPKDNLVCPLRPGSSFRADGFVTDGVALTTAMDVDLCFAESVFRTRHETPRLAVFFVTGDGTPSERKEFRVADFCEQVNWEHVPQVFRKEIFQPKEAFE